MGSSSQRTCYRLQGLWSAKRLSEYYEVSSMKVILDLFWVKIVKLGIFFGYLHNENFSSPLHFTLTFWSHVMLCNSKDITCWHLGLIKKWPTSVRLHCRGVVGTVDLIILNSRFFTRKCFRKCFISVKKHPSLKQNHLAWFAIELMGLGQLNG